MVNRKWMKELGIVVTRSIQAYEKYEVPGTDLNAFTHLVRIVNRTFALGFTQEELVEKNVNFSVLAEKIIPEIEKRLVLGAFNFGDTREFFKWEKPEGQSLRYFRIEEIEEDLLDEPINIEKIKDRFDKLEDSKLIFQERWPWGLGQEFEASDMYKLRARLAAQIIPKEAKLVEED